MMFWFYLYCGAALYCTAAWWLGILASLVTMRATIGYSLAILFVASIALPFLAIFWPFIAFKNMFSESIRAGLENLHGA